MPQVMQKLVAQQRAKNMDAELGVPQCRGPGHEPKNHTGRKVSMRGRETEYMKGSKSGLLIDLIVIEYCDSRRSLAAMVQSYCGARCIHGGKLEDALRHARAASMRRIECGPSLVLQCELKRPFSMTAIMLIVLQTLRTQRRIGNFQVL